MRLLVAEDHPSLARSLANGLREEGFVVDVTSDGTEALHLSTTTPYDCIILDIMLPGIDGWEIVTRLREARHTAPVLFLTAKDAMEDRVKGLNLGADDYLVKPFAWEELLARVRALVRRKYEVRSPLIQIADLSIDTTRRTVSRGGEAIKLSTQEFNLLAYLAARQGEVVSRRDIWTHLYDDADEGTSNVIDVYIAYLRAKIDKHYSPKLIHTRHGAGYVLAANP
jgi:two-component system copper resistance phosphate regulon response regulator CusR